MTLEAGRTFLQPAQALSGGVFLYRTTNRMWFIGWISSEGLPRTDMPYAEVYKHEVKMQGYQARLRPPLKNLGARRGVELELGMFDALRPAIDVALVAVLAEEARVRLTGEKTGADGQG